MTKITMIGAGHLASQMSIALSKAGHVICQVYSRSEDSASHLSKKLNCPYTTDIKKLIPSDLAIIAVTDSAIQQLEKHIHFAKVHTSGTKALNILNGNSIGVFYPLQTFSKNVKVDFSKIPICIESENIEFTSLLKSIAKSISNTVIEINSIQRRQLHLAAVFSCNFSNLMYSLSQEICVKNNISFELMHSLIKETAQKIQYLKPQESQTGPASRRDYTIIEEHLKMLSDDNEKQQLYKILSNSIINRS